MDNLGQQGYNNNPFSVYFPFVVHSKHSKGNTRPFANYNIFFNKQHNNNLIPLTKRKDRVPTTIEDKDPLTKGSSNALLDMASDNNIIEKKKIMTTSSDDILTQIKDVIEQKKKHSNSNISSNNTNNGYIMPYSSNITNTYNNNTNNIQPSKHDSLWRNVSHENITDNYHPPIPSSNTNNTLNISIQNDYQQKRNHFHFRERNIPRNPFQKSNITSIKQQQQQSSNMKPLYKGISYQNFNHITSSPPKNPPTHEYQSNAVSVKEYAYYENKNYPNRKNMQDYHCIVDNFLNDDCSGYFAIFDGHGGQECALYLSQKHYSILHNQITNIKHEGDVISHSLTMSFELIDNELKGNNNTQCDNCGSTATVVVVTKQNDKKIIYCANVGDSKCILVKKDKTFNVLTKDHKCFNSEEAERIRSCGGMVFCGRMFGQLALSRAIGDFELKPYGLLAMPDIERVVVNEEDDLFVVIASDGVWDVMKEDDVVGMCLEEDNEEEKRTSDDICTGIVKSSIKAGTRDNVSCIVVKI